MLGFAGREFTAEEIGDLAAHFGDGVDVGCAFARADDIGLGGGFGAGALYGDEGVGDGGVGEGEEEGEGEDESGGGHC